MQVRKQIEYFNDGWNWGKFGGVICCFQSRHTRGITPASRHTAHPPDVGKRQTNKRLLLSRAFSTLVSSAFIARIADDRRKYKVQRRLNLDVGIRLKFIVLLIRPHGKHQSERHTEE